MIEKLFENILREANSDRDSFKRKDGVYCEPAERYKQRRQMDW